MLYYVNVVDDHQLQTNEGIYNSSNLVHNYLCTFHSLSLQEFSSVRFVGLSKLEEFVHSLIYAVGKLQDVTYCYHLCNLI